MRLSSSIPVLLTFLLSLSLSTESSLQTIHLHYLSVTPPSTSSPFPDPSTFSPLATLTYSPTAPHNAHIAWLTPAPNTTEYTAIALFSPSDPQNYRSTVTATRGFHAPFHGRFRILLSADGLRPLSASYYSFVPSTARPTHASTPRDGGRKQADRGEFDIEFQQMAHPIYLDRPGKKLAKGQGIGIGMPETEDEEGKVEEKTFLQKYWWLLLGVLAVSLLGPGEK